MEYSWPGYKVHPVSKKVIENKIIDIKSNSINKNYFNSRSIDLIKVCEELYRNQKYTLVIDENLKYLEPNEEAKTDFFEKTIIIPRKCYDEIEQNIGRARFTLAHEIGHVVLHSNQLSQQIGTAARTTNVLKLKPFESSEWQANYFAAALLMNKEFFTNDYLQLKKDGYDYIGRVINLSDEYNTSITATKKRIQSLGLQ